MPVDLATIQEVKKSQMIRLLDVTVLGPLMLYYGWKGRLSAFERGALVVMGAGTVIYNWNNYYKNKIQNIGV